MSPLLVSITKKSQRTVCSILRRKPPETETTHISVSRAKKICKEQLTIYKSVQQAAVRLEENIPLKFVDDPIIRSNN